jgi:isocitrate dehydrogenase
LRYRGQFDNNAALIGFADTLEQVVVETVQAGHMTKDLALLVGKKHGYLSTTEFMDKLAVNLRTAMDPDVAKQAS